MRKIIAVVLWAGIPFSGQPLRGQTPTMGVKPKGYPKNQNALRTSNSAAHQGAAQDRPIVLNMDGRPKSKAEAAEEKRQADRKENIDTWMVIAAVLAAGFTGALVIVGWRGVGAAKKTLVEIKRQADLTQAQFDQWVELENWRTKRPTDSFRVQVDLVNNTAFPVTISDGYLMVTSDAWKTSEKHSFGTLSLTPNKPHLIDIWVGSGVLPETLQALESASFSVKGMFSHRHRITKQEVRQPVEGNLRCGPWKLDRKWHADYTATVHMNPERAEAEGDHGEQKAN